MDGVECDLGGVGTNRFRSKETDGGEIEQREGVEGAEESGEKSREDCESSSRVREVGVGGSVTIAISQGGCSKTSRKSWLK